MAVQAEAKKTQNAAGRFQTHSPAECTFSLAILDQKELSRSNSLLSLWL